MAISTRDLRLLPNVRGLRALLQSHAMLDAILSPEWEHRYFSFDAQWADGEQLGSMRNGSGDELFALFNDSGAFVKGFAHEAPMSPHVSGSRDVWPGILDSLPTEFVSCLHEAAFNTDDTTFCIWRRHADRAWQRGSIGFPDHDDPDGSELLLSMLDGKPETYCRWAEVYYERSILLSDVQHVFAHARLHKDMVRRLNPCMSVDRLAEDVERIGYPCATDV